jgi:prefoldin subunit 5
MSGTNLTPDELCARIQLLEERIDDLETEVYELNREVRKDPLDYD